MVDFISMETKPINSEWESIFDQYSKINTWLEGLITDPKGLRYLKQLTPFDKRKQQEQKILRMRRFCEYLELPQNEFPTIHVTGTSGKGSVSTYISQILVADGLKTGLHTSPYVQVPNEKIAINNRPIKPSSYTQYLQELRKLYEKYNVEAEMKPTYSDMTTALVLWAFMKEQVECAVIEVGVGGRFDSTNVVNSNIAVITNIGYDHLESIGPTLQDVAWHKSGIIKPCSNVVIGETDKSLRHVFDQEVALKDAKAYYLGEDFTIDNIKHDQEGLIFDVHTLHGSIKAVRTRNKGTYQATNAGIAIFASQLFADQNNREFDESVIRKGVEYFSMPVRFEIVEKHPLIILDGAHNPPKMQALSQIIASEYPSQRKILAIGMIKTKDAKETLKHIASLFDVIILTKPDIIGKPLYEPHELADVIPHLNPQAKLFLVDDPSLIVQQSKQLAQPEDLILITGSIYMMGKVREYWYPKNQLLHQLEYQYDNKIN